MSYAQIHQELDARLQTVVGLPALQLENVRKTIPNKVESWTRSTLIPARTDIETIGINGFNRMNGLYQIDLFYPADASYQGSFDLGDEIIARFTPGINLGLTNIINSYIRTGHTYSSGNLPGYYNLIVIVEWSAYKQRPAS